MWYSHTVEYYSVTKRIDILIHSTIGMNLENILCDRSSDTKGHICIIPFKRKCKSTDTESRVLVFAGRGWTRE